MPSGPSYRKGSLEGMEAPTPSLEQEDINGTVARSTPDHVDATNATKKHTTSGSIPKPLGAKGHSGT